MLNEQWPSMDSPQSKSQLGIFKLKITKLIYNPRWSVSMVFMFKAYTHSPIERKYYGLLKVLQTILLIYFLNSDRQARFNSQIQRLWCDIRPNVALASFICKFRGYMRHQYALSKLQVFLFTNTNIVWLCIVFLPQVILQAVF